MRYLHRAERRERDHAALRARLRTAERVLSLVLFGWTILAPAYASSGPWVEHAQVRARLITPWSIAPSSRDLQLGVEFQLAPGWHAYWKNPGDAGYAPEFKWSSQPPGAAFQVLWPAPHRFILPGELQSIGYAERVIYPVQARFSSGPAERTTIESDVRYLVCSDSCIPYRDRLEVEVRTGARPQADVDAARDLAQSMKRVPRRASTEPSKSPLSLTVTGSMLEVHISPEVAASGTPEIFFASHPLFETGIPRPSLRTAFAFSVPIRQRDRTRPLPSSTIFEWTLTGSKNGSMVRALEGSTSVDLHAFAPPGPRRQPN